MKPNTEEVNSNMALPRELWLWLEEAALARARMTNGRKPTKKQLVREALDLLRAQAPRT